MNCTCPNIKRGSLEIMPQSLSAKSLLKQKICSGKKNWERSFNLKNRSRVNLKNRSRVNLKNRSRVNLKNRSHVKLKNRSRVNLKNRSRVKVNSWIWSRQNNFNLSSTTFQQRKQTKFLIYEFFSSNITPPPLPTALLIMYNIGTGSTWQPRMSC